LFKQSVWTRSCVTEIVFNVHMIYKTLVTCKVGKITWPYALRKLLLRFEQYGALYLCKPGLD